MKFFHVYNEECIKGLEINGLLNKDTGFKIQHCFSVPKERQFNHIAKVGGKLHSLIKENSIPFYVDRIAGGATYYPYSFDKVLIAEYRNLLGDEFLGFQLHESASNIRNSDWPHIMREMGSKGPYDAKLLRQKLISPYAVTPEGEFLVGLSHDTPEHYANCTFAETVPAWMEEVKQMFLRRLRDTDNNILAVDSYYLFTKLQDELGIRTFMPEVGAQIGQMRIAVALARGIARGSRKKWGTYYECWRAELDEHNNFNYCMPCFNLDPINEWYLKQEAHPDDFTTHGPNGGSSRLLQERIYYHTLMSGADYFGEEWGLNCSYTDMQTFDLSPYGQIKKRFIGQALELQNVKAMIPFAIVLPKEYGSVMVMEPFTDYTLGNHSDTYMGIPLTAAEKDFYGHVEDVLKLVFAREEADRGNEGHVLTNSRFGDVFDIIYEDASEETFARYEALIDATPDGRFAKAHPERKVLESSDFAKLSRELNALIARTMPIYADGLHWLVSTDDKGRRFLTVFNNEGNLRTSAHGDTVDRSFDQKVTITLNIPGELKIFKDAREDIRLEKTGENTYCATVSAADFVIFEF